MNIKELTDYLSDEIAYFKKLKANNEISPEGKIKLSTFEHILEKILGES